MKSETDALLKEEKPIFVKEAREKFLQLGKAYAKSIGECPDGWKFFYPELKVAKKQKTEKQFMYSSAEKTPKLIPYKSEEEKIPEKLREIFLTVAGSMKSIASHGGTLNENQLVAKREELELWLKKLSDAIAKEKIKKSSKKEWLQALDEATEFLHKYKNFSEEQLQSPIEIKSSCCQII